MRGVLDSEGIHTAYAEKRVTGSSENAANPSPYDFLTSLPAPLTTF
jgi:hypothetical protein